MATANFENQDRNEDPELAIQNGTSAPAHSRRPAQDLLILHSLKGSEYLVHSFKDFPMVYSLQPTKP